MITDSLCPFSFLSKAQKSHIPNHCHYSFPSYSELISPPIQSIKLFTLIGAFPLCVDEPQREGDPGTIGTPGVCAWEWNIVKEKEEIKSDGR